MSVVTLVAPASAESSHRIMFVDKGAGLIRVASYTLALECGLPDLRRLRRVNRMAIAAQEFAFRNRMVVIQPELGYLCRMALAAQRNFVRFEQELLFRLLARADDASRVFRLPTIEGAALQI
jgi:hypothetical protein